jgi:6,7-dimethyl-8-ribityllumazine synthase
MAMAGSNRDGQRGRADLRVVPGTRFALVASRFNAALVGQLVAGAQAALREAGAADADVELHWVPGAWELPAAALWLAASERFTAIVALGCVVRGGTPHFEFVAGECARGLMKVQLETGVPVAFGVLTVDSEAQAAERADPERMDKGGEAALAALEMANLVRSMGD